MTTGIATGAKRSIYCGLRLTVIGAVALATKRRS